MALPHIEQLDNDGAIREQAETLGLDTRGDFLRKTAVGGSALLGGGALFAALPEVAGAKPSKKRDIKILNYALTLEYLEAAFYKEAVGRGALDGQATAIARLVADHETTHVSALRTTIRGLKGRPVSRPKFDFGDTTASTGAFLDTSVDLENTGVAAYLGQAGKFKSKALLLTAASIVTTEARHASAFAVLLDRNPFALSSNKESITPYGAFDRAFNMKRVLKIVRGTGFIQNG